MRIPIKGTIIPNEYKDFYNWFGIDSTCPRDVETALENAGKEDVIFEINSGGGEIFSGSEIYSKIRSHPGEKEIQIVGFAGSAASVIACAAKSKIAPTAMMMIHNVQGSYNGDWQGFAHETKSLRECSKAIAAAYTEKTKMAEAEVMQMMDEETWITAQKAVEYGFADEILPAESGLYNALCTILTPQQIQEARNAMAGKAVEEEKLNLLKLGGYR